MDRDSNYLYKPFCWRGYMFSIVSCFDDGD